MEKPALAVAVAILGFFAAFGASRGGAVVTDRRQALLRQAGREYAFGLAKGAAAIVLAAIVLVAVVTLAMPSNGGNASTIARTSGAIAAGAVATVSALAIGAAAIARARARLAVGPAAFSDSIAIAVRAALLSSVAVVVLAIVGVAGVVFSMARGGSSAELAGFAFGAAMAALVARAPGVWRGETGSSDARHPSLAVELATLDASIGGGRAGALVALIASSLAGATIAASTFGRLSAAELARAGVEARDVVALPLVLAAFSIVAVVAGAMAVKAREDEEASAPMARGLHVAAPLALLGAIASTHWVVRAQWRWFAAAAALGVIGAYGAALVARIDAERAAGGDPLRRALTPTLTIAATVAGLTFGAHRLGAASGLAGGGAFGVALAGVGFVSLAPVVASFDVVPSIARGAARIVALHHDDAPDASPDDEELVRVEHASPREDLDRIAASEDVGVWTIVLHAGGATVVSSFVLVSVARRGFDPSLLAPLLAALVGASVSVGVLALLSRARERTHEQVVEELRRALDGVPAESDGTLRFPLDFHADAAGMLGRIANGASSASLAAIALVLVAAIGAAVLRVIVAGDAPAIAVGAATIVGVMQGVAFDVAAMARDRRDDLGVGLSLHVAVAALAGGALLFFRG